jgi:hypothetical protein
MPAGPGWTKPTQMRFLLIWYQTDTMDAKMPVAGALVSSIPMPSYASKEINTTSKKI